MDEISDEQLMRYARHVVLEEVGEEGQIKLLESKVLVIGAGGLGSPVLMYLAAAGVGTLGVVDDDVVDITNLQRQIVHGTEDIDRPKVDSAEARLRSINPEVQIHKYPYRIVPDNAIELISQYDLVLDGCDNFDTRYMINDACYLAKTPLVSAALLRFEGQLTTIKAFEGGDAPCYRCIFPSPPAPGDGAAMRAGRNFRRRRGRAWNHASDGSVKRASGAGAKFVRAFGALRFDELGYAQPESKTRSRMRAVWRSPDDPQSANGRSRRIALEHRL